MTNDKGMMAAPPTTNSVTRSPAAERMRAHRERRRLGISCLTVQLFDTEIGALIGKGLLKADTRNDPDAVREALYAFLDSTLGQSVTRNGVQR
jgi:hypothetical protein